MTLLAVDGAVLVRGGRRVVDGVSLGVARGEKVALMGHNGSGKTSLLRGMVGLLPVRKGRLVYQGAPVRFGSAELRDNVGVVFQEFSHDAKLTVHENLRLGARLFGLVGAKAAAAIAQMVAVLDIAALLPRRCEHLSGGQRRRVELARALLHGPALLLLDEPCAGLDPVARQAFAALVDARRRADGMGVLWSTHDAHEAEAADRVVLLGQGRVLAAGAPEVLLRSCPEDVIALESPMAKTLPQLLHDSLGLKVHMRGDCAEVRVAEGHRWVPKVVEALRGHPLTAVRLRRASLADVMVRLMGPSEEAQ